MTQIEAALPEHSSAPPPGSPGEAESRWEVLRGEGPAEKSDPEEEGGVLVLSFPAVWVERKRCCTRTE